MASLINSETIKLLEAGETSNLYQFEDYIRSLKYKSRINVKVSQLIRIGVIADGSSLLHAILQSYYKPYQLGKIVDDKNKIKILDRREFVEDLRNDLADQLNQIDLNDMKVGGGLNNNDIKPITNYEKLIKNMSNISDFDLGELQYILKSNYYLDYRFHQYIANIFKLNIYFIQVDRIHIVKSDTQTNKSIIIYMVPSHYELVGYRYNSRIKTIFENDHIIIKFLNDVNRHGI